MTIKSFGARRAQELTPDQLLTSYRATLLVIDHITDATQTARAVVVRDMASGQERITTDPVEIRALHDHATAGPSHAVGDGLFPHIDHAAGTLVVKMSQIASHAKCTL
jgi:hypothetical protein